MSISKQTLLESLKKFKTQQDSVNDGKFVAQEEGKSLMLNTDKTKLDTVAQGAQVNVIEIIKVDDTAQAIDSDTKVLTLNLSAYAKKSDVSSALNYKGSKDTFAELPTEGNNVGDVWNIKVAGGTDVHGTAVKAGDNVAYNGTGFDVLGGTTDLSSYSTTSEIERMFSEANETITDEDIAGIFTASGNGD